ncbi:AAA family ATPase [Streptomyces collinus]|uniref:helix-turn-helix transcriptional regulator n=1 Tax=Streptomyces collinus TaxID=42684 RepID=UPI0036E2AF32
MVRGLWERDREYATLAGAVKVAAEGQGGLVMIEGAAGIGKTRLLAEARRIAVQADAKVMAARGMELESDFAFGVVRQLFDPLLIGATSQQQEALWQGPAGQVREILGVAGVPAKPLGEFAALHGLYWLTVNLCQDQPIVLLVDDLQWCDAPSLRYLAYLLPRMEGLSLVAVTALRTGEAPVDEYLVHQLATDPAVQEVLRPAPLSVTATSRILEESLAKPIEHEFAVVCHRASAGNPLLLAELARTWSAEHLAPTAADAGRVLELRTPAVTHLVQARLQRLPAEAITLARSVAVLGDQTSLTIAVALANAMHAQASADNSPSFTPGLEAVTVLEQQDILHLEHDPVNEAVLVSFTHPLIRSAVYDTLDWAQQAAAHVQAARLLIDMDAEAERIAAHLLNVPATDELAAVRILQAAADQAVARGAPGSAHLYLARCLHEPLTPQERWRVLAMAGEAALRVDAKAAVEHFRQAQSLSGATSTVDQAELAVPYASTLLYTGCIDECEQVIIDGISKLSNEQEDLRRRFQAWLVIIVCNIPGHEESRDYVTSLQRLPSHDSLGGRMLDCALALKESNSGNPNAILRAQRGLAGGPLMEIAGNFSNTAWMSLAYADDPEVADLINEMVDQVHRRGDLATLAGIHYSRGLVWLRRGQLADAEIDLRESLQMMGKTSMQLAGNLLTAWLAQCYMEQGKTDQAATLLDAASDVYIAPYLSDARAQLLYINGDYEQAVQTALSCSEQCDAIGIRSPAPISWRTWAMLSLLRVGKKDQANSLVEEELQLARHWGTPGPLGRALRNQAQLQTGVAQLETLREAIDILKPSTARLEYAKTLAAYGTALRRSGQRNQSRMPLRYALDLATSCGAAPLAEYTLSELIIAGGRPRSTALSGPAALTPSERRVAELAVSGATNRTIAQSLFITPKTVEVHLSAVYRKLGVKTRTELTPQLLQL